MQAGIANKPDGRRFIAVVLACYFAAIGLSSLIMPYDVFWSRLQVQASQQFDDFVLVPRSCELVRQGIEPIQNPENTRSHVMFNYPRVWLLLSYTGLSEKHTNAIVIAFIALFFLVALAVIGPVETPDRAIYAIFLCSPPVMLAVARGNTDLVVFSVLGLGLVLLRRAGKEILSYGLVFFAALLKLFPIFAIVLALRENGRRWLLISLSLGALFLGYLWISRDDISVINRLTPRLAYLAFGARVIFDRIDLGNAANNNCAILGCVAVVLIAYFLALRNTFQTPAPSPISTAELDAFRVGAAVYAGSFALLMSNGIYRMTFVLLMLPQILAWKRIGGGIEKWALAGLACILISAWLPRTYYNFWHVDQLTDWLLFLFCVHGLLATAPAYLKGWLFPGGAAAPSGVTTHQ